MRSPIWIVVFAVLVLTAPAGTVRAELVDAQTSASLDDGDDNGCLEVHVVSTDRGAARTARAARREDAVLPPPVLAGVFRPPRPSFD